MHIGIAVVTFTYTVLLNVAFAQTVMPPFALEAKISADSIKTHIMKLGDDAYEGRGTGSSGCENAAAYISNALRLYGIRHLSGLPDYFQKFPLHGSTPIEGTEFKLFAAKDSYTLRLQEDYVLYSAGAQTFIPTSVRLIFVGYGIIAPEFDYNDYQNIDVKNAIVVFLSGEPASVDESFFEGGRETVHSSFAMKQKIALARGARGSILIPNPRDRSMDDWYEQQKHFLFEEVRLLFAPSENLNILLNVKLASFLFTDAPHSFEEVETFDTKGTMKSFPLTLRASFQGKFKERDFLSANVIGMVEGSDPVLKDSYVLLSAHYDHLGIGVPVEGDSIYNGVFDNASGVSALLEIARSIAANQERPKRSILFVFLTGEERGFLGSQFYCLNPVVPLYKTVANINIDGISLFENVRSFIGVGAELSTLGTMLQTTAASLGLTMDEIPHDLFRYDQFRNSDQFMFAQAGIPSILIAEGLHYQSSAYSDGINRYTTWAEEKYHSPVDDLQQPMNFDAAAQHASFVLQFALSLANSNNAPQWYDHSPFLNARLRSISKRQ
ncbi:MAG: M28 family peptidase [Bacteroidota bacterium]